MRQIAVLEISANEFTRNFGQYCEIAQREPVAVMNHGQVRGYFMSAVEFEELQRYKKLVQPSFTTSELPAEVLEMIASSRMSSEQG